MKIRRARTGDIDTMLQLKSELRFQAGEQRSARGGFLLGSSAEDYEGKVRDGIAWVLEEDTVEGFAIALPDDLFKASALWRRRHQVHGKIPVAHFEALTLGYFDQLAVRPGASRRYSAALALTAMMELMEGGTEVMITTTVVEPVVNFAAVPFVQRMGGQSVGRLAETDPHVGALVSEIWVVTRTGYSEWMQHSRSLGARWIRRLAGDALTAS